MMVWYAAVTLFMAAPRGWGFDSVLPPMNGVPSDFAPRRAGADVLASIRVGVTNDGIFRITQPALTNAGVTTSSLTGSIIRLFGRTQEVAIYVSNSGLWTTNDYLLFAGTHFDGEYSITNVYWLGFGPGGKRMATRSATPFSGAATVSSCRKKALHHVDYWMKDTYRWDDESFDHWIDQYMSVDTSEQTFSLPTDQIVASGTAVFEGVFFGLGSTDSVNPDHCTRVRINGNTVGQFLYDGEVGTQAVANFSGSVLQATNTIGLQQIDQPGVSSGNDRAYLERFSITYTRSLLQNGNTLLFDGTVGTNNYQVGGFTNNTNFSAFDIRDPANAVILTGLQTTNTGGGTYAVRWGDSTAVSSRYAVCHASGLRDVVSVQRVFFRDLTATNRHADYVVICPYEFRDQAYRLLKLRYVQGLSVAVAPLPDLYNEFSYGLADAGAIKQFIGYAFHHWTSPPKYVLLAGAGTYDPRRNRPDWKGPTLIPAHMGPGFLTWTGLDGWYAAVAGNDNVPDVALGRISVETTNEFKNVVDKILSFENLPTQSLWRTEALLAAVDFDGVNDFQGASEALCADTLDPNGFWTTKAYLGIDPAPRQTIKSTINAGVLLVNYFGHGAIDKWATQSGSTVLLDTNDVYALTNAMPPIMTMLTCMNGYFESPSAKSLAEIFLERANRGAVACVGDTGLSTLFAGQSLADGFYRAMLTDRRPRIGDAILAGYANLYQQCSDTRELLLFSLFGDPAMRLNQP